MNHARRSRPFEIAFIISALLAALPLTALVEPEITELRAKSFSHPDLYIGNIYQPATEAGAARSQVLADLGVSADGAYLDIRGGRWGTLIPTHPLLPGDGVGNELSWDNFNKAAAEDRAALRTEAWSALVDYVTARQAQLGVDVSELQNPGVVTLSRDRDLIQIHVPRRIGGVEVRNTYFKAVISHGNLILMGTRNWGDMTVSPVPSISTESAIAAVSEHLGELAQLADWGKQTLVIIPMAKGTDLSQIEVGTGYDYRLVWEMHPSFEGDPVGEWEALVDAHTGEVLALQDKANYASTREIDGGVYPVTNDGVPPDGVEVVYPMPFADITNGGNTFFSDSGGNLLACVDGEISTTLSGRYLRMIDNCGAINESTMGDLLSLGTSGGIDCTTPPGASPGNTHASRSGFYEIGRSIEWGQSHLPDNVWLQGQLPATMNINSNCNASGGPGGVNFFTSGGGCSNTGEIAGVFVHEWGHGMDGADATPGISSPGEGIADIYASLRLNTSCIGRNFRPGQNCGGYGDPCTECSGVRDIDFAKRASGLPHDIAFIDGCGPGNTNGPCGGSVHCEGAVYGEAVWDLWHRDLTVAPYSMDTDTAREVATRLTFVGSGGVGAWFNCNAGSGTGDGCNADGGYLNYLAADDDDGSLANGTPHMTAINAAFARHGIACPTPAVLDGGCAGLPTTAPVVTATPRDRSVELSWGAVAGANSYRVFRGEGVFDCDFGKIWIADVTDTSYIDSGLRNGQEYYYSVFAMAAGDTCFGPASACTTAMPSVGANLGLDTLASGAVTINTGDGDIFLDNCEEASVAVSVSNLGDGTQNNVRIVDVRAPNHPEVVFTSTFPVAVSGSLAACDIAAGSINFQAAGLSLGDSISFEIDFTSDELSPGVKTLTLPLNVSSTESDFQNFANRTFSFEADAEDWSVQEGTFDRTTSGGGSGAEGTDFFTASSGFLANQCDHIRSPVVSLAANSVLTMWTNFNIEDDAGGTGPWYDRANVGIYDPADGSRTLVQPSAGRGYNASGANGTCGTENQNGWGGTMQTWASSTFNPAALGAAGLAGTPIQFDIRYGTDSGLHLDGFTFDQFSLTNVDVQVDDMQSDVCGAPGFIFFDSFESGDTVGWSSTTP
ncbi:MAG: hypothetical protein AAF560_09765 [Acidobacteriota bacterium]